MKKCAYCGRSNEDLAIACSECGEEFEVLSVSDPQPKLLDPTLSPIIVAAFSSLPKAKLLADRLEAAGIEAFIPEEYGRQVFSEVIPLEPVTVRVAAKDCEAAKAIVSEDADPTLKGGAPMSSQCRKAAAPESGAAQTLTTRQPNYYYGHAYLGSIYLTLNDLTNAEAEYLRAYELFPTEENEKNLAAIHKRLAVQPSIGLLSK